MLNDCVTVHNKKPPKYAEIFKLAAELAERDIPFGFEHVASADLKRCYLWHVFGQQPLMGFVPRVCTVVQGTGTKGFEDGLLEITGLLYPEEEAHSEDGSLGWLTAGNVLERILKKEAEKNG